MTTRAPETRIEYRGIRCTDQGLLEIDSGRVMVDVPKETIGQVTLRNGVLAPHPFLQGGMGVALVAAGYFPMIHLIQVMHYGGGFFTLEAGAIPLVLIGIWLLITLFKRGYFLDIVQQKGGVKRLAFDGTPELKDLDAFLKGVEQCHGLTITRQA